MRKLYRKLASPLLELSLSPSLLERESKEERVGGKTGKENTLLFPSVPLRHLRSVLPKERKLEFLLKKE